MISVHAQNRLFGKKCKLPKIDMSQLPNKFTEHPDISVYEFNKEQVKQFQLERLSSLFVTSNLDTSKEGMVRWIDCDGYNKEILDTLNTKFGIHTVAISDIYEDTPQSTFYFNLKTNQQGPNFALYSKYLFLIFQLINRIPESENYNEREQVSIFVLG